MKFLAPAGQLYIRALIKLCALFFPIFWSLWPGEDVHSSTEGCWRWCLPNPKSIKNFVKSNYTWKKLIMGTRAQAFTAKIKNLQEIQVRLMQGSLPLPQGHEIANSLKYFRWNQNIYYGQIHLVLNKTLTDDTSVKRAQIKTFFCLIQFCWNLVKL